MMGSADWETIPCITNPRELSTALLELGAVKASVLRSVLNVTNLAEVALCQIKLL